MYELDVIHGVSGLPVFTLADVNQVINNRAYAKRFLKAQVKKGGVFKIKKNMYTIHKDPLTVSTFILRPSYISAVSALSMHRVITQMPNEVFCATQKKPLKANFFSRINFFHTQYFFGFSAQEHGGFNVMVADPEKAIIDSFSIVPVHIFEEAIESIDQKRMLYYLKKIKKSSIIKRVGYLMENNGFNVYKELAGMINYKYIGLDPMLKPKGKKDKKWGLIINTL